MTTTPVNDVSSHLPLSERLEFCSACSRTSTNSGTFWLVLPVATFVLSWRHRGKNNPRMIGVTNNSRLQLTLNSSSLLCSSSITLQHFRANHQEGNVRADQFDPRNLDIGSLSSNREVCFRRIENNNNTKNFCPKTVIWHQNDA